MPQKTTLLPASPMLNVYVLRGGLKETEGGGQCHGLHRAAPQCPLWRSPRPMHSKGGLGGDHLKTRPLSVNGACGTRTCMAGRPRCKETGHCLGSAFMGGALHCQGTAPVSRHSHRTSHSSRLQQPSTTFRTKKIPNREFSGQRGSLTTKPPPPSTPD